MGYQRTLQHLLFVSLLVRRSSALASSGCREIKRSLARHKVDPSHRRADKMSRDLQDVLMTSQIAMPGKASDLSPVSHPGDKLESVHHLCLARWCDGKGHGAPR